MYWVDEVFTELIVLALLTGDTSKAPESVDVAVTGTASISAKVNDASVEAKYTFLCTKFTVLVVELVATCGPKPFVVTYKSVYINRYATEVALTIVASLSENVTPVLAGFVVM